MAAYVYIINTRCPHVWHAVHTNSVCLHNVHLLKSEKSMGELLQQAQQNWPANTGAVTHVYTTVFSFTTGGNMASYAV